MISVVIPLYNKAPHIEITLRSVLAQTLKPHEIIVVDDGSTDGSAEVVQSLENNLITLIRQKNLGVSAARNTGITYASSKYIALLDGDDIWLPSHLETIKELITQNPDACLYSTMHEIHLDDHIFTPCSTYPKDYSGEIDDFFLSLANNLSLINSSTACIRKDIFIDIGGFPIGMKRGEDLVTWIRMARTSGMAHAAKITAIYNRNAINRSSALREKQAPGSLLYLQSLIQSSDLSTHEIVSARLLFERISFYTAAGMKESSDIEGLVEIRKLAAQMHMPKLSAKLFLLTVTPKLALTYARRFRHHHTNSNNG